MLAVGIFGKRRESKGVSAQKFQMITKSEVMLWREGAAKPADLLPSLVDSTSVAHHVQDFADPSPPLPLALPKPESVRSLVRAKEFNFLPAVGTSESSVDGSFAQFVPHDNRFGLWKTPRKHCTSTQEPERVAERLHRLSLCNQALPVVALSRMVSGIMR